VDLRFLASPVLADGGLPAVAPPSAAARADPLRQTAGLPGVAGEDAGPFTGALDQGGHGVGELFVVVMPEGWKGHELRLDAPAHVLFSFRYSASTCSGSSGPSPTGTGSVMPIAS